jgi:Putative Ig domain
MRRNVFSAIGAIGLFVLTACGGGGAGNSLGGVSQVRTLVITSAAPPGGRVAALYDGRYGPPCKQGSPSCVCLAGALLRPKCNVLEHGYPLAVTGGTAPYSFKWVAAATSALPPGLTLSAAGLIDGSPTAVGSFDVVVTVSDASNPQVHASASYPIVVAPAPLAIATTTLANGVIGTAYNQTIQATGGAAPFAWTVSSGALPHNLSLSTSTTSTVTLSGTPDTAAAVAFTIQVTYPSGDIATQAYSVSILPQADSLVLSPGSLDFGAQSVGSASRALPEMLTNTSTSPADISGIAIAWSAAAEFNQTTTCGTSLAAGASCVINVSFTPGQIGPRFAGLIVTDDAPGSPHSVPLSGVGLTAGPNATPATGNLQFGTQLVGTTSPEMSVALNNYGTATLNIVRIAATPSFAETDDCVPSLASGATCTIKVTFTAGSSGDTPGTLSISDDAPASPQKVLLTGTASTNTPLLNGYCLGSGGARDGEQQCGVAQDLVQCPAGQPSFSPGFIGGRCAPGPTEVDGARTCKSRTSAGLSFSGNCLISP